MEQSRANDALGNAAENREELSADAFDPVIEAFKRDIDFTLVERNLKLTIEERVQQLQNAARFIDKFRPLVSGSAPEKK